MPLSDWDVLALDELGRPSNGTSEPSPAGVTVSPHEGGLQVASPDGWHPMCPFSPPQFAVVRAGSFDVLDIMVLAGPLSPAAPDRGLVWATWYFRGADVIATVGVTVRGFGADGRYAGVTAADVTGFKAVLAAWATTGAIPRGLADLGVGHALRFNQGDAYFSRSMGHACSATPPGEAELPLLYLPQRAESMAPHIIRRDSEAHPVRPAAIAPPPQKPQKPGKARARKPKPRTRAA